MPKDTIASLWLAAGFSDVDMGAMMKKMTSKRITFDSFAKTNAKLSFGT